MNPEGIRTGRSTTSAQSTISVGTSSGSFVLAAPNRIAIIVSAPVTNRFTLSFKPTAVLDEGITLHAGGDPLVLTVDKHGDMATRAWSAISATASQNVAVIEVFLA